MGIEEEYQIEIENIVEETFGSDLPPQLKKELINDISKTGKIDEDRVIERFTDYGYLQKVSTSTESRINDYSPRDREQTIDIIHKLYEMSQKLINKHIEIENQNHTLIQHIIKELDKYHEQSRQLKIRELKDEYVDMRHQIESYDVAIDELKTNQQLYENKLLHKLFKVHQPQIETINIQINLYENLIDDCKERQQKIGDIYPEYKDKHQLKLNELLLTFNDDSAFDADNPFGEE